MSKAMSTNQTASWAHRNKRNKTLAMSACIATASLFAAAHTATAEVIALIDYSPAVNNGGFETVGASDTAADWTTGLGVLSQAMRPTPSANKPSCSLRSGRLFPSPKADRSRSPLITPTTHLSDLTRLLVQREHQSNLNKEQDDVN
jgi:hypothetical protein